MKRSHSILPVLALAMCTSTAWANAGTPLMWASMFHLLFGNVIIGIIEGLVLVWVFKCSKRFPIPTLIVANYVSAWVGALFVAGYLRSLVDITIENIQGWFLAFVVVAFVVTLLTELAFVWFTLGFREHRLRRALTATLTVNGLSYILLFGGYWTTSATSMMTRLAVVSVDQMRIPGPYAIFYLSEGGDQVIRADLSNPDSKQAISAVKASDFEDHLFARPRGDSGFDLFVLNMDPGTDAESMVMEDFAERVPSHFGREDGYLDQQRGTSMSYGEVPSIGAKSDWVLRIGFWPAEGISGQNAKTGERFHYGLELPFVSWPVRHATQISGSYVVAQLGSSQICLMDLESRRIALIARGKGPIVVEPKISRQGGDSEAIRTTPPADETRTGQP